MADVYEIRKTIKWHGDTLHPGDRISADEIGRAGGQSKVDSFRRLGIIAEAPKRVSSSKKRTGAGSRDKAEE
jgi:hypothetical protein